MKGAVRMGRSGSDGCATVAAECERQSSSRGNTPLRVVEAGVMFRFLAAILVVVLSAPAVLAAESVSIPGGEIAIEFSRAPGELDRARMLRG